MISVDSSRVSNVRSKIEEREIFIKLSAGRVDWVRLKNGEKSPSGYRKNCLTYSKKMHTTRNVGAHPIGQTVIFDIDTHHTSMTPDQQLDLLKSEFGLELRGALTVRTPSGGYHIYTVWPKDVPLPGNWKLSCLRLDENPDEVHFSGDLRAAGVNGHCVIPGSDYNNITYRVIDESPFCFIPSEVAQKLVKSYNKDAATLELAKENEKKRLADEQRSKILGKVSRTQTSITGSDVEKVVSAIEKDSPKDVEVSGNIVSSLKVHSSPVREKIEPGKIARLKKILDSNGYTRWHQKRAAVFNALSCCHSIGLIFKYWVELDICKDTASGGVISDYYLLNEMTRLKPATNHGIFCGSFTGYKVSGGSDSVYSPEKTAARTEKLKQSTGWREPVVLHQGAMLEVLSSGRKKPGKYHQLAVAIIEDFLQPWSNFGVSRILLASSYLSDFYGVDVATVNSAKKLLARKGLIYVKVKQAHGRTTSFGVNPSFVDEKMTNLLRYLRKGVSGDADVFFDARSGIFYNGVSGEIELELEPFAKDRLLSSDLNHVLPERLSEFSVLSRVLPSSGSNGFAVSSASLAKNAKKVVGSGTELSDDELFAMSDDELDEECFTFAPVSLQKTAESLLKVSNSSPEAVQAVLAASNSTPSHIHVNGGERLSEGNLAPITSIVAATAVSFAPLVLRSYTVAVPAVARSAENDKTFADFVGEGLPLSHHQVKQSADVSNVAKIEKPPPMKL